MKYLLILLISCCSLFANAQQDSTANRDYLSDTIQLELPVWKYFYMGLLDPSLWTHEVQSYLGRAAKRWNGTDTSQLVKTANTYRQFLRSYENQLKAPDGLTADFNNDLLEEILPQVQRHPWLLARVLELRARYADKREKIKEEAKRMLETMKAESNLDQ